MNELKEKIAELVIENEKIKKTSKSRFNQNKELKSKVRQLEILKSRFNCLKAFLDEHGFTARCQGGVERVDFSLFNALRGLIAKDKRIRKVSVDGVYAVKINGVYSVVKIFHSISWRISFPDWDDDKNDGLHFYKITDFILLEMT